jgi:hypothetical protein
VRLAEIRVAAARRVRSCDAARLAGEAAGIADVNLPMCDRAGRPTLVDLRVRAARARLAADSLIQRACR